MHIKDFPKITVIMRGLKLDQAHAILTAMEGLEKYFSVEITMNTPDALSHIEKLNQIFGHNILIGAGTVRNLNDAKQAHHAGAKFLLGPHMFGNDIFEYAEKHNLITVPSAMTPSEVNAMINCNADIIKIFPAAVVTPRFFKDIQAPLGQLPLMAVGGISEFNAKDFLDSGATYLGIGSGLFKKEDIEKMNTDQLGISLKNIADIVYKE